MFDFGELVFVVRTLCSQLDAALVDVADELLVDVVGFFEGTDEPLVLVVDVLDRLLKGSDLLFALVLGLLVERLDALFQQSAAVFAEDVGGEVGGYALQELIFTDPVSRGWVVFWYPSLLGGADVVGVASLGLAVHTSAA